MSCLCVGCNPAKLGCGTPECVCTPCVRPNSAVFDFELGWNTVKNHCVWRHYTTNCNGFGGYYAIQNCDIDSRVQIYSNTYIVDKSLPSGDSCDDFNYELSSVLSTQTALGCTIGSFTLENSIDILIGPNELRITLHGLNLLLMMPCSCFPCMCLNLGDTILEYTRNTEAACNQTSFTYKTRYKDSCLIYPREITVELVDI